jgi:hypothetical protein
VTAGCDGGSLPDPAAFTAAAGQAARSRSASIISAHLADTIISVVTVTAPDRYAAVAVARAVVSDALKGQACHLAGPQTTAPITVRRFAHYRENGKPCARSNRPGGGSGSVQLRWRRTGRSGRWSGVGSPSPTRRRPMP